MLHKMIAGEIWNESNKDLNDEYEASLSILDEVLDGLTKEFFFENFNEIKGECLELYKKELQE